MDNTNRFDGKGEIYSKARPKYAEVFFENLKKALNIPDGSVFADIGSGTGIFTGQLLDRGWRVFAVEPNADMRKKAEEKLSRNKNFISVNGSDKNFNLPDNSVDFLTAAQAFHWFDPAAFRAECRRVLKPGGKVILVYNSRDENADCTKALADLRRRYCPEFHGFSNGISEEKCVAFFNGKCEIFRAGNTQYYDRNGYIERVLSSSYSLNENDKARDEQKYNSYINEINRIFDDFSENGIIVVPTNTVAYAGSVGDDL